MSQLHALARTRLLPLQSRLWNREDVFVANQVRLLRQGPSHRPYQGTFEQQVAADFETQLELGLFKRIQRGKPAESFSPLSLPHPAESIFPYYVPRAPELLWNSWRVAQRKRKSWQVWVKIPERVIDGVNFFPPITPHTHAKPQDYGIEWLTFGWGHPDTEENQTDI